MGSDDDRIRMRAIEQVQCCRMQLQKSQCNDAQVAGALQTERTIFHSLALSSCFEVCSKRREVESTLCDGIFRRSVWQWVNEGRAGAIDAACAASRT